MRPYWYILAGVLLVGGAFLTGRLPAVQQVSARYLVGATDYLAVYVDNPGVLPPPNNPPPATTTPPASGGVGGFYYNPTGGNENISTTSTASGGATTGNNGTGGGAIATAPPPSTGATGAACSPYGDFNNDGKVDTADFTILLHWYAELPTLKTLPQCADLTGDGKLTLADFSILAYGMHAPVTLPASAANLSVYPASITLKKGDAVGFYIRIQSRGSVNAAGASVVIPSNLAFLSAADGTVLVDWVQHPTFNSAQNGVTFAGIVPGGWSGDGTFAVIRVAAKEAGTYSLSYNPSQTVLYQNDGKATPEPTVYAAAGAAIFEGPLLLWALGIVMLLLLAFFMLKRHYTVVLVTDGAPRASAGGIVLNGEGKLLLVFQHSNTWSFPKGGVDKGETELEAAKREIREETGITDLALIKELGSYERYSIGKDGVSEQKEWGLRKRTIFLFTTSQTVFGPADPDGEITDVRWVTIDEALALLSHPKDKEFLAGVRATIERALK